MKNIDFSDQRPLLRLSAILLLGGQLLMILSTVLHAEGDANDHHAIFATYEASANWKGVHLGQSAGMALLLVGFVTLSLVIDEQDMAARLAGRLGAATAMAALALAGIGDEIGDRAVVDRQRAARAFRLRRELHSPCRRHLAPDPRPCGRLPRRPA